MQTHHSKNKIPVSDNDNQNNKLQSVQFKDNRPESTTQLKVQQMANNAVVDAPIQRRTNNTGMPDNLKSGIENLSGLDMSDVKVHYNSSQPAQLQAHAFAQGNQIHIASGQERHLPHEAWHVVQQKQGRVAPTTQLKGKIAINDDGGLEKEADIMGERSLNIGYKNTNSFPKRVSSNYIDNVYQLIKVSISDYGKNYNILPRGYTKPIVGKLEEIKDGRWYRFNVNGFTVYVQGQASIISEMSGSATTAHTAIDGTSKVQHPFNLGVLSTTHTNFDIKAISMQYKVSPHDALQMIAESYRQNPRTIRITYPNGKQTITKGYDAFDTPGETTKAPQAMVSYRKGDYKAHNKLGKDYDDWADELSQSGEPEKDKQKLAERMHDYLSGDAAQDNFIDLPPKKKVAMDSLLTATQISDRLRTEHRSAVTPQMFLDGLKKRSQGKITFHKLVGDKKNSTFLPARTNGSHLQRQYLQAILVEIQAQAVLYQNNCLINAITNAALGRDATEEELVEIRSHLANVGEMMIANPATIAVIRTALHIPNVIVIRYPVGTAINETFAGTPGIINIYHTGGNHFQNTPASGVHYDMS